MHTPPIPRLALFLFTLFAILSTRAAESTTDTLPTIDDALASKQDVWGLAAMLEPDGPSYEFFEKLLPPLRYVNATFRYYPIILSAPGAPQKARLVSNGSALNPHAELKSWKEKGVPVTFRVDENQTPFGDDLRYVEQPRYEQGWLPIVQIGYETSGAAYTEETFASVDPALAAHGVAFARFQASGPHPILAARIKSPAPLKLSANTLVTTNGHILVWFDQEWTWDAATQTLTTRFSHRCPASLAIASTPVLIGTNRPLILSSHEYKTQKNRCIAQWKSFLSRGMNLQVPEPVVNNAWRSLLVGGEIMAVGDRPNYSWGNAYERLYEAESSDAARAFLLWGFSSDFRRMLLPLLDYSIDPSKFQFHNAGFKLQTLAHYYWLTRDTRFVKSNHDRWQKYVTLITDGREPDSGLAPRENYCGDISTSVYSLNSNAAAWRGLHDIAAMLADMGESAESQRLFAIAADYRRKILAAVDKSEQRDVHPPFIPIALFGEEKSYDVLTSSKLGSYWDLLAPYVIGSGIFGPGSERERTMLDYLQEHGGICMGMIRFDQHSGLFANENGVDDLYGLRYVNTLLRLDEPERALVSFYGKLAQGMTRDTFIGGEGTSLKPLDAFGRPMYLPPDSAANAHFLWTLRYLLVQDWDTDDDGKPDTLRLLFATPKRWLADGKTIKLEHAPTAFGEISLTVKSRLQHGEVIAEIALPQRDLPQHTLLRIRVPDGWKVDSAKNAATSLPVDEKGTIELPSSKKKFIVRFAVSHTTQ